MITCVLSPLKRGYVCVVCHRWTRSNENRRCAPTINASAGAPGTELTKLLASMGFAYAPDCECRSRAAEMDRNGCDWCAANLDTIVDWLAEEAQRQNVLLFNRQLARVLVQTAIRRARKRSR